MLLGSLGTPLNASTRADLDAKINTMTAGVNQVTTDVNSAFSRLKAQSNLNRGALVVGGIVSTAPGSTVNVPITLVVSTFPVAGLQFDVLLPSSFTITSVTAGPVVTQAGKSVNTQALSGFQRVLIIGLNQTLMKSGLLVTLALKVGSVPPRMYPLSLSNQVASDPAGSNLILSALSGIVEVK